MNTEVSQEVRQQEFVKAYNSLCQRFGVQLAAVAQSKTYGSMLQIEANLQLIPVENWKGDPEELSPILPNLPTANLIPN